MAPAKRYAKKRIKAIIRRRLNAKERHERPQQHAQRDLDALHHGGPLELVGRWGSGQHKRVVHGIDGVRLLIVVGDGPLVVPIDCAVRPPNPTGPGARCRDKLPWAKVLLDETLEALAKRGLALPPPLVVADSWLSDSKLMGHVADAHQGTLLVQGKATYTFITPPGQKHIGGQTSQ